MDCLFCNIAAKKITAQIVFEDPEILAFYDIHPQAPLHILIIPKIHIATINDTDSKDETLLGRMILTARKIAQQQQIAQDGYRLVFNTNGQGCQQVYHIHLHLIGGRQLHWPPG